MVFVALRCDARFPRYGLVTTQFLTFLTFHYFCPHRTVCLSLSRQTVLTYPYAPPVRTGQFLSLLYLIADTSKTVWDIEMGPKLIGRSIDYLLPALTKITSYSCDIVWVGQCWDRTKFISRSINYYPFTLVTIIIFKPSNLFFVPVSFLKITILCISVTN